MWWETPQEQRAELEHWHSSEHFPERMDVAGFLRGSRWADQNGIGFFVLYELESYEVLTSAQYVARLNKPSRWTIQTMSSLKRMVRSQCRIELSHGDLITAALLTLRLSPAPGEAARLRQHLAQVLGELPNSQGVAGAHLLRTDTPPGDPTQEQILRGMDQCADWVILVAGYDIAQLDALLKAQLQEKALVNQGASPHQISCIHLVRHSVSSPRFQVA